MGEKKTTTFYILKENCLTKKQIMDQLKILNLIAARGGIYGKCAEIYRNDHEKARQFLMECFEQCHLELAKKLWGIKLIREINNYYASQILV